MRVYLGVTLGELAKVVADGGFGPAPIAAHAVTPALREWFSDGDLEELEYAATTDAARASLAKLAAAGEDETPRRVVVAAEVPDSAVKQDNDGGRSSARIFEVIPYDAIDAVLIDEPAAEAAVSAAAAAWAAAESGDEDAVFMVDEAFGYELLWYARQEIPDLLP